MQQVGPAGWGKRVLWGCTESSQLTLDPSPQTPTALCGHTLPTPARFRTQRLATRTVRVRAEEQQQQQQGDGPRLSFKPSQRAVSWLVNLSSLVHVVCPPPPRPLLSRDIPTQTPIFPSPQSDHEYAGCGQQLHWLIVCSTGPRLHRRGLCRPAEHLCGRGRPACCVQSPLVRWSHSSLPLTTRVHMQPRQYLSGSLTDNTSGVAPIILVAGAIGICILGLGLLLNGGSSPSEATFWRMLSTKAFAPSAEACEHPWCPCRRGPGN